MKNVCVPVNPQVNGLEFIFYIYLRAVIFYDVFYYCTFYLIPLQQKSSSTFYYLRAVRAARECRFTDAHTNKQQNYLRATGFLC